jgi:hypothetical protein
MFPGLSILMESMTKKLCFRNNVLSALG